MTQKKIDLNTRFLRVYEASTLGQVEFANEIGCSPSLVSRLLNRNRTVTDEIWHKVVARFSSFPWFNAKTGSTHVTVESDAQADEDRRRARILSVIKECGISQIDFAKRIGYSQQHISNILSGEVKVSTKLMLHIEREFNISFVWLKTGKGDKTAVRHDKQFEDNIGVLRKIYYDAPLDERYLYDEIVKMSAIKALYVSTQKEASRHMIEIHNEDDVKKLKNGEDK